MGLGITGPIPKRSDERIRRNKPDVPIEKLEASGTVEVPPLGIEDAHPLVADFYDSLGHSAQTKYYEPSDWQHARWVCTWMDKALKHSKPSAMMLTAINSAMTDMLVTEGARRRVRLEIERSDAQDVVTDVADRFKEMLSR